MHLFKRVSLTHRLRGVSFISFTPGRMWLDTVSKILDTFIVA